MRVGGVSLCVGLTVAAWLSGQGRWLAAAVPAIGYGLVALTFARTLRRGQEPLIAAFCRIDYGQLPDECRGYTRRLTMLWAVMMSGLAAETIVLPLLGLTEWLGIVSIANAALMISVFLGEHAVRGVIFPHLPIGSPLRTGRIMLQTLRNR